jgi:hypothetical protein
MRKTLEDL